MSTAAVKWGAGSATVRRRQPRKARRDPALRAAPQGQAIPCLELERIQEGARRITRPPALARVEHALFALILATVGYLWLAQAMGLS